jgi:hypothetical protein
MVEHKRIWLRQRRVATSSNVAAYGSHGTRLLGCVALCAHTADNFALPLDLDPQQLQCMLGWPNVDMQLLREPAQLTLHLPQVVHISRN